MLIHRLMNRMLMNPDPGAGGGGSDTSAGAGGADTMAGGADTAAGAGGGDTMAGAGGADTAAGAGGGDGGKAGKEPPKATWPDDWRDQMAGGDEKLRKQLDRFTSPKDVHTSWRALQAKLSSGELKSVLPKDAKPEEVAKWREENGIPDKPEGYKMPEGVVVGEADKPMIDTFLKSMHAKNATPDLVQEAIKSYYAIQEQQVAALAEADVTHKQEMEDTLRAEWGGEYRGNVNAIKAMLETAPGGIADKILSARMGDGRAVANDPDVLRWLASTARELNPVATLVPAGGDQNGAIDSEIAAIEKRMRTDRAGYNKDEKMQARYRDLIEARDRRK